MKNLYSALGVLRTATKEQIRSKYREQAQRFHPDKPGGNEARFKELQEAYATLVRLGHIQDLTAIPVCDLPAR